MFSLPSAKGKKEPKCQVKIGDIKFVDGPPKKVEVTDVKNAGDAECVIRNIAFIRPSTSPNWTEVAAAWDSTSLKPSESTRVSLNYEWISGTTYFIKVATEKGIETLAYAKAP